MLINPLLFLTLAAAFAVPGSDGQALEGSMTLPFALAVGKVLFTPPRSFIEFSSTKRVYISEGHVLALADTQCLHTETPPMQLCFGNRWPTRIRLLPNGHLKVGLHSSGLSQLAYMSAPSFITNAHSERKTCCATLNNEKQHSKMFFMAKILNPVARAIGTKILQGVEQQNDIVEQARQRSLMLSHLNNYKSHHKSDDPLFEEPLEASDTEEDSDPIEWWGFAQQPTPDTNDSDVVKVRLGNDILLKPDTRYCFTPGAETKAYRQAVPDEGAGSEDNDTSDENSNNDPDEEETETDSDVKYISTTADPFPVSREIREYCAALEQQKIKQEPLSDSEIPIGSEVVAADSTDKLPAKPAPPVTTHHSGKKHHPCQECGKTFSNSSTLKRHQRTHSGEKSYLCQVCGKAFSRGSSLRRHQRTHSGEKPYLCQECGKTFAQSSTLKTHQHTHNGEKPHQCQECGKTFAQSSNLKRHRRTHSGEKPHRCQVCGKAFTQNSTLKTHQRTHNGKKHHRCQVCGKTFSQHSHLKRHQCKHRTAEEPPIQRK